MEFWGVEVKIGELLKVDPGNGMLVHISQAALGEAKRDTGNEPIYLYLLVDNQKFVLGTLSHERFPQITVELALEKGFELAHSWKNGSVYFTGYKVHTHDSDMSGTDEDTEEELPLAFGNGKPELKANEAMTDAAKSDAGVRKQVKFKEPNKDGKPKQEDDDSDEDEDMLFSEESDDDEGQKVNGEDDSDETSGEDEHDEDDEESSDADTPKKPEPSKKRPAESALKTPTADQNAKVTTQTRPDGKKSDGHTATPHPAKQAGKKPANIQQPNQQTPKSGGSHPCKSCNRSFASEMALQSHTKAKHSVAA